MTQTLDTANTDTIQTVGTSNRHIIQAVCTVNTDTTHTVYSQFELNVSEFALNDSVFT